jgi:hypothetical protein
LQSVLYFASVEGRKVSRPIDSCSGKVAGVVLVLHGAVSSTCYASQGISLVGDKHNSRNETKSETEWAVADSVMLEVDFVKSSHKSPTAKWLIHFVKKNSGFCFALYFVNNSDCSTIHDTGNTHIQKSIEIGPCIMVANDQRRFK